MKMDKISSWIWSSIFLFYVLTDTGGFITQSSVIPIDDRKLIYDHVTKKCKNFMERVKAKIVNCKQPLFDGKDPDRIY